MSANKLPPKKVFQGEPEGPFSPIVSNPSFELTFSEKLFQTWFFFCQTFSKLCGVRPQQKHFQAAWWIILSRWKQFFSTHTLLNENKTLMLTLEHLFSPTKPELRWDQKPVLNPATISARGELIGTYFFSICQWRRASSGPDFRASSSLRYVQCWSLEIASNRNERLRITPPLKPVWTMPFFSWNFFLCIQTI